MPIADAAAIAARLPPAPAPQCRSRTTTAAAPTTPLDEAFFRANVEPILQKKGADGYACVNCHATHTLFNATWSTVKNVIDRNDPENSLLLRKPISTAETEGVAGRGCHCARRRPALAQRLSRIRDDPEVDQRGNGPGQIAGAIDYER